MEHNKDYFYTDNKYVNSQEISFSPDYIRKVRIIRFFAFLIFLLIVGFGIFAFTRITSNQALSNNLLYTYSTNLGKLNVNDSIVYVDKKPNAIDKLLITFKLKETNTGLIMGLPHSTYPDNGRVIQLDDDEYKVGCLTGNCTKDEILIIEEDTIIGKIENETSH